MDEECYENQDLINKYQHDNIQIIKTGSEDLIESIESEYLIYLDSNNCHLGIDLKNICNYLKNHDCDVLSFNSIYAYDNADITYENDSYLKKDLVSKILSMPKFIDGIYNVDYLKKLKVTIPRINDYCENMFFYFKTMFSTSKMQITQKATYNKRIYKQDIKEHVLTDFAIQDISITDFKFNTNKFFKTLYAILDIFEEKDLIQRYGYQIFNYIFNLLRNLYQLCPADEEDYFVKLKDFTDMISFKYHNILSFQLKYDNMQFWKNVSKSHVLSELNLRYDYENLLIEKEKAKYQQSVQTKFINKFLTARFDVKNKGGSGNSVEVVDAIEGNVNMRFPSWFKDASGSGLIVESSEGVIDFSVRCVEDGVFTLWLKGVDFRDVDNNRVPIFVDFTRLLVDGEVVFDENLLVNHNAPFIYEKSVKDGQEISIHAEWLPLNKNSKYTTKKSNKNTSLVLKKFLTARFDVKNKGGSGNSVEVVDAIEGNVNMRFPSWFKDASGSGLIVESSEGVIDFSVRCVEDGVFTLWLKGVDFRDVDNNRVPIFVDFTRLLVDGEVVFDENLLVNHNAPFIYEKSVKDGQEISIHAEWLPLNKNSKYTVK